MSETPTTTKRTRRSKAQIAADELAKTSNQTLVAGSKLQLEAATATTLQAKVARAVLGVIAKHWPTIGDEGDAHMQPTMLPFSVEVQTLNGVISTHITYDLKVVERVDVKLEEDKNLFS